MELSDDPYDHPDGTDCIYIHTSLYNGDDLYNVKCECTGETPCADITCKCANTCGINYLDGKLVDEKQLSSDSAIFECNELCGCGSLCKNRESQKGPYSGLRIVEFGSKGYGVVADAEIPKGTFLCEYAGELSTSKPVDADWRYVITLNETSHDGSATETFINATKFGNVGRYLNHSCDPNAVLVPIRYYNVTPKVGIFAVRDISKGEECCYLYAPIESDRSETPCLCGSSKCCGFLPLGFYAAS